MKVNMSVISNKENHEIIKVKGDNNLNVIIYANGCMATVLSGECDDEPRFICGLSRNLLLNAIKDNELSDHIIKLISTKGSKIKMTDDLYSISKSVLEIVKNNTKKRIKYNGKQVKFNEEKMGYLFKFNDGTDIYIPFNIMYSLVVDKKAETQYWDFNISYITIHNDTITISCLINNLFYDIEINKNTIDTKELRAYKLIRDIKSGDLFDCKGIEVGYGTCRVYIGNSIDTYRLSVFSIPLFDLFVKKINKIDCTISAYNANIEIKCSMSIVQDCLKINIYDGQYCRKVIYITMEDFINNFRDGIQYNTRTGK